MSALSEMGLRLKKQRLQRNESQKTFAARIGVTVPTLKKMEDGDPAVRIGSWLSALDVLDATSSLDSILASDENLFERHRPKPVRQRASKQR